MKNYQKITVYEPQNLRNKISRCKTDLEKVIEEILTRDISSNSKLAFQRDLQDFLVWFQQMNNEAFTFSRSTKMDLVDFKNSLLQKYKPASINRKISSLKTFFKTAKKLKIVETDLSEFLKSVSNVELAPKSLSESETRKFLKEVELHGNKRDKLIIGLMLYAGLRSSEILNLRYKDIEISPRKGVLTIRNAKGNKTRKIPISLKLRGVFEEFFEACGNTQNKDSKLFFGQRGELTDLNQIIEKYSKKSQVPVHPHVLRHTFAYSFLKRNPSDILAISQLLGHSNLSTTAIYTQNRFEDLEEKIERI